jgi:CRP-like cAMP-binding protein
MQDTLGNLFAGLSIQLERPFQVGDSVTIDAHTGKVVQVAWRATRIENTRREVITLPNNILSKQPVKNYSRGAQPIGVDVPIRAPHDVPPNRVKDVVLGLLTELPLVLAQPAPRCFVTAYEDSAIRYTVRYFLADFMQADQALDQFYSRLWYRLRREGIATPVPQQQTFVVNQPAEASPDELPPPTRAELLGTVDLFESLGEEDRRKLSDQMSPRRFGKGEQIIAQGAPGTTFYLVASGEVSVWAGAKPDLELARLRRGQYFGEMSLLTGEPRAATVTAATDVLLLELDREIFAQLFANHPGLMRRLSALLAQRKNQLEAATESFDPVVGPAPEAGRILGRLRQMFGLNLD